MQNRPGAVLAPLTQNTPHPQDVLLPEWCRKRRAASPPRSVHALSPLAEESLLQCVGTARARGSDVSGARRKLARVFEDASLDAFNEEQQGIATTLHDFLHIEVLRAVASGQSVFFTGCAGTGKSHLLREIIKRLPTKASSEAPVSCTLLEICLMPRAPS
jgi:hypothetical protein